MKDDKRKEPKYYLIDSDTDVFSLVISIIKTTELLDQFTDPNGSLDQSKIKAVVDVQADLLAEMKRVFNIDMSFLKDRMKYKLITSKVTSYLSSHLEHHGSMDNFDAKRFVSNLEEISEITGDVDSGVIEASISDKLISMKIGLIEGAIALDELLATSLFRGHETEIRRHFYETVAKLSRDVAMNWSKRSNISDHETLFEQIIPFTSQVYLINLKKQLAIQSDGHTIATDKLRDFWSNYPVFKSVIEEMHMGYGDDPVLFDNLLEDIQQKVSELVNQTKSEIASQNFGIAPQHIINTVTDACANVGINAWKDVCNEFMDRFKGMSKEEFMEWSNNPDNATMDLTGFYQRYDRQCAETTLLIEKEIDYKELEKIVSRDMVSLWGISDAIFKIKKV